MSGRLYNRYTGNLSLIIAVVHLGSWRVFRKYQNCFRSGRRFGRHTSFRRQLKRTRSLTSRTCCAGLGRTSTVVCTGECCCRTQAAHPRELDILSVNKTVRTHSGCRVGCFCLASSRPCCSSNVRGCLAFPRQFGFVRLVLHLDLFEK